MSLENELLKGRRILVADDEFLIAAFLKDVIEEAGAVVVGPAHNFADAMKLAETPTLDGALLDVNLGGRQAFPVAARLQARGIPIAFLTGMEGHALPEEFRADKTLTKPVPVERLLELLESFFR